MKTKDEETVAVKPRTAGPAPEREYEWAQKETTARQLHVDDIIDTGEVVTEIVRRGVKNITVRVWSEAKGSAQRARPNGDTCEIMRATETPASQYRYQRWGIECEALKKVAGAPAAEKKAQDEFFTRARRGVGEAVAWGSSAVMDEATARYWIKFGSILHRNPDQTVFDLLLAYADEQLEETLRNVRQRPSDQFSNAVAAAQAEATALELTRRTPTHRALDLAKETSK